MSIKDFDDYSIELDKFDIKMLNNEVVEKGVENYLSLLLVYLDCSRIINNMRMMQTIGYPYKRYISIYLYILNNILDNDKYSEYENKLISLHLKNLDFEKENPPIIYDKKGFNEFKFKTNKHPRKRKAKEQTIPGFGKEVTASQSLKSKLAGCANVKFTLKPPKK